eukprot:NODE_15956_length_317_cov_4.361940_g14790_i0.p1 GENE.NODE_15956_length_317_cov_4.361940_g14790_i0~~NODE_15956_length_317_cov_4.361940_g14790_i0.p1  ORF type:complete len:71 (+),score=1.74 NODE_15956_length_317_cov_4.361940_g14790_i0:28-213(+)
MRKLQRKDHREQVLKTKLINSTTQERLVQDLSDMNDKYLADRARLLSNASSLEDLVSRLFP